MPFMSNIQISSSIPTVTQDDLHRFHLAHFSNASHLPPTQHRYQTIVDEVEGYRDYDDDGLGYYSDGVKRRLTDEQIAIFRHSEIQTLFREREQRRERDKEEEEEEVEKKAKAGGGGRTKKKKGNARSKQSDDISVSTFAGRTVADNDENAIVATQDDDDDDDDDVQYKRFLRREREAFNKGAKATSTDRGLGNVTLVYDDDDGDGVGGHGHGHDEAPARFSTAAASTDGNHIPPACHGRRILVYEEDEDSSSATTTKKMEFLWPRIGGS
ncbi:MAG: hypothetical protein M1816_008221 [Peltula sp. TS41687]|nr:MAG: hypothetical protein M1816_008221 [Peltula sp. TS41687]